ncbi:MAG: tRNA (N6-threonylcarbamoyladenosine(37)-N6)-methyltransferase TrmO [Bacillota bacterium]
MELKSIGTIHTPYKNNDAPFQPLQNTEDNEFYIELNEEYVEGLKDLDTLKYIYLLYYLDQNREQTNLTVKTPWSDKEIGLFATRSPNRINSIGLSVVRLLKIEANRIYISSLDAFDGTPLLDIKPYMKDLDTKDDADHGWLEEVDFEHLQLHIDGKAH